MNEQEKKLMQYANGFSITANKESGEFLIAFTQNQPFFNAEEGKFESDGTKEVFSVILPYSLGTQLGEIVDQVVGKQNSISEDDK